MLKIGEFSKLSRVSVRMLRHYDEIGLLKPARIDRFTDYRYYREDQLPTAGRIAALKDMGFSLSDIVRILEAGDDRERLESFFTQRQAVLLMYVISAMLGLSAVTLTEVSSQIAVLIVGVVILAVLFGAKKLGIFHMNEPPRSAQQH